MHPTTFDQVIERARSGNEFAWSVLYDRYAARLRGYAAAQGSADPDSIVGDVFADVAHKLIRFTGDEASLRSWLFMIAHSRIIDERRRARPQPPVLPAAYGNAEREAIDELITDEIIEILAKLSPEQRDVLLLRIVADLSVAETARILCKKQSAVKAAQRRGLMRLRDRTEILGVTP